MDSLPDSSLSGTPPCMSGERRHGNRIERERTSPSWQIEDGTGSRGSSAGDASGSEAHEANRSGTDMTASPGREQYHQMMDTRPDLAAESSLSLRSIGSPGQSLPGHSRQQRRTRASRFRRQRGHRTSASLQGSQDAVYGTTGVPRASHLHGSQGGGWEPRLALARSPLVCLA